MHTRKWSRRCVIAATLVVIVGLWSAPPVSAMPNPSTTENALNSVSAVSSTDAWAVGSYITDDTGDRNTLIVHWDGANWTRFASPNPVPGHLNELRGVYARATDDVWAVGVVGDPSANPPIATLILHWNGVKWKQVTSANPGAGGNQLYAVSADASGDAWAVGTTSATSGGGVASTLIEKWNGASWSQEASVSPGVPSNILTGVTAVSATKAWAVGTYYNASANAYDTLIETWNGTSWSKTTSPNPVPAGENRLNAVSASGESNAWAVGTVCSMVSAQCAFKDERTLVLHWDGSHWTRVASPDPSATANFLNGVSVDPSSPTDVWAVGWFTTATNVDKALTVRWNGTSWSKVATPNPSASTNFLHDVAAISTTDALAVGVFAHNTTNVFDDFALHWTGAAWSRT